MSRVTNSDGIDRTKSEAIQRAYCSCAGGGRVTPKRTKTLRSRGEKIFREMLPTEKH